MGVHYKNACILLVIGIIFCTACSSIDYPEDSSNVVFTTTQVSAVSTSVTDARTESTTTRSDTMFSSSSTTHQTTFTADSTYGGTMTTSTSHTTTSKMTSTSVTTAETTTTTEAHLVSRSIPLNDEALKYLGRTMVSEDEAYVDWSASGVEFLVQGGSVEMQFEAEDVHAQQRVYMAVYVDDERTEKFRLSTGKKWYTIAEDLPTDKVSTVKVVRLVEASMGKATLTDLRVSGKLCDKPDEKPRKIEWIGDSITCGYGVLGASQVETFQAITEDVTSTYAWLCSDALDAERSIVSASGYGVIASANGDPDCLMPKVYPFFNSICRMEAKFWDYDRYQPDLVVINLGTNDYNGSGGSTAGATMLRKGIRNFLTNLRSAYPNAKLCWIYGMMTTGYTEDIQAAVEEFSLKDGNTAFIAVVPQNVDKNGYGANYHPNTKSNEDFAEYLIPKLRDLMNW